jgi:hypothetical protein
MAEIEYTSLFREIDDVINSGPKPVHYSYQADVIANDQVIKAFHVVSVDNLRDYELNYADELTVSVLIPRGTYAKRIFPFQDNLEVILRKTPLREVGDYAVTNEPLQEERYTAVLLNTESPIIEGNGMNTPDEAALNLVNIDTINFQLINKAVEQLRTKTVGGVFRNTTVEQLVVGLMTRHSQDLSLDKSRKPIGVDMVPANNKEMRTHIEIKYGTRLVDLPLYVHRRCGGIYSAGLSYYFEKNHWYVYPCYNTERFKEETKTLTIINVPPNKFPKIERTYRQVGDAITILATGKVKFEDSSDADQLNAGNGVRFSDARRILDGFAAVSGNRAIVSRVKNNSEFLGEKRKNGMDNVLPSRGVIQANPFLEYSELTRKQGSVLQFAWENSDPVLLFPGMMARILYQDNGVIKETVGILLKVKDFAQTKSPAVTDKRHITYSALTLYVRAPKETES